MATDDGSAGFRGFIPEAMGPFLRASSRARIMVITCGPKIMMRKVAELCQKFGFDCYVILESVMACGIGVCLGCSVKMLSGQKRICHEGPIFNAKEVDWNALG
jgi:dihydroorotate dehydrogenase electron transfer subunit